MHSLAFTVINHIGWPTILHYLDIRFTYLGPCLLRFYLAKHNFYEKSRPHLHTTTYKRVYQPFYNNLKKFSSFYYANM